MRRLLVGLSAVSLAVAACAGDTKVDSATDSTDSTPMTSTTDSTTTTSITLPTTTTSTTEPPPEVKACGPPERFDPSITWQIETVADGVPDLPRHISCARSGVYVYQRNSENVLFFSPEGEQGTSLTGVGEPKGNESLVVFHTWDDIHFKTDSDDLEFLFDDSGADDAVPIGDSEILATGVDGKIAIYDLDGNERWSRELAGFGQAVKGDDAWWVADNEGRLYRIPLDGSDPGDAILIPKAEFPGKTSAHRPAPAVVSVPGGVWITNSDGTIQFIDEQGQLGESVKVAAPARSGGGHMTDTQGIDEVGGYLYTSGFRLELDGSNKTEVDQAPLTAGGGYLWYLGNNLLTAKKQDTGEVGFQLPLQDPQGTRFAWAHGALWIADQNHTGGFVYRISHKD